MARNSAATNAGVGQASVTTKIKLTIQAAKKCIAYGALPMFVLPLSFWLTEVSPQGFDLVKIHALSAFVDADKPRKWRMRNGLGVRQIVTVRDAHGAPVQYLTPSQIRHVLAPIYRPVHVFEMVMLLSCGLAFAGYMGVWILFTKRGEAQQKNKIIRGGHELVDGKVLNDLVRKRGASDYTIADVALPHDAPMKGILALGAQGSGKSLIIHDLMQQVFERKRKTIVYDPHGEFYRAYFRPGKDFFFNPAMLGSEAWSIFSELQYTYDANTLSQAFLPPKASNGSGANSFFEDAARALFSVILARLAQRGAVNTKDISRAFLEMPEDEMNALIRKSVASSSIGGDSKGQRQGVISSISIYLDGIGSVQEGNWSVSRFLSTKDDARLFLLGTKDTAAMFSPLYRLILQTAFSAIAARQEIVHTDRYWFILDEIHTLGDIRIDEQLAELRKNGVCALAGTQNDSQFITALGKDRAETAMNGFNTILQLRMNEPNAQKRAAERLSKAEVETISQNQAVAVVEQRDGAGIVINEQEKWIVMPGEIGLLDVCVGYLKLSGPFPTAKVDYRSWLPTKPGKRSRVDRFAEVQGNPPRDERFLIDRISLPSGESAFDDVRRQVEKERAQENERKNSDKRAEAEKDLDAEDGTNVATGVDAASMVVDLSLTQGALGENHQPHTHNQNLDLGL